MKYLPFFLEDIPGPSCPKAGHAAYGNAVRLATDLNNEVSHVSIKVFLTYACLQRKVLLRKAVLYIVYSGNFDTH